jgi:hypothetical protein
MDVLYHYCPTDAFVSIVASHSIWLSSLSLANDTMEGKIVSNVISRLAERDKLDLVFIEHLQKMVGVFEQIYDGLGFCLSEDGDFLGQWRGYASDATGVSIGFSRHYIEWLAKESLGEDISGFTLMKVQYEPEAHEAEVLPTYAQVRRLIEEGAFKLPGIRMILDPRTDEQIEQEKKETEKVFSKLSRTMLFLFPKLFLLKSSAFREEKEWRLLSHFICYGEDTCCHRSLRDQIIPYRSFQLKEPERQPIVDVVLGPKHLTPTRIVEDFLRQNNYGSVTVRRSEVSYR